MKYIHLIVVTVFVILMGCIHTESEKTAEENPIVESASREITNQKKVIIFFATASRRDTELKPMNLFRQ